LERNNFKYCALEMNYAEDTFKSPRACWEANAANVRKFIKDRKCHQIAKYHQATNGCSTFDRWVSGVAGDKKYHETFFNFYTIVGPIDQPRFAPYRLAEQSELRMLALYDMTKRYAWDIEGIEIPDKFDDWPDVFRPDAYFSTSQERRVLLKSLENCIIRRQEFRKLCVVSCSKHIKGTASHDQFLLILQILRAKVIMSSKFG